MKERQSFTRKVGILAALILTGSIAASAVSAGPIEIIPSVGLSKSTDENAGDAKASGGLALRAAVLPFLKLEGGISYRQDSFADDNITMRTWPVTASAWLSPFPMLYAGGGIGWYRTTFDFDSSLPFEDTTSQELGVHVGGGLNVPISPKLGLDVSGRYIFMQEDDELEVPTEFNPDFWSTSVGLAISF